MSEVGDVVLEGDKSRRVTVPLPRSLQELQYHANRNFARDRGPARMFHHGYAHLHHPHHVGKIQDGDVVVVEAHPKGPPEAPAITTHQSDFVKHNLDVRKPLPPAAEPLPGAPFNGMTSYKMDYIKHPPGFRKPIHPPKSGLVRPDGATGKTMYSTQYPWHDTEPRRAVQPPPGVPLNNNPFQGMTSYMNDYVKHPIRPRSSTPMAKPRGEQLPFEATTTYNNDFQNIPSARTMTARPHKATLKPEGSPFEGSSEYKREYVELKSEPRPMVHLEPEIKRTIRASSTPNRRRA